eukprot:jgi/Bigna1/135485/aug1.29_g10193
MEYHSGGGISLAAETAPIFDGNVHDELFFEDDSGIQTRHAILLFVSLFIVWVVCLLFAIQTTRHIGSWKFPAVQKHYIRIIMLAPIEAITAWFTVLDVYGHPIYDAVSGVYEAYVLLAFAYLMLNFKGGFTSLCCDAKLGSNPEAGFHVFPCCGPLFRCSFSRSLTISIVLNIQFLIIKAANLFFVIFVSNEYYHHPNIYVPVKALCFLSMILSLIGLLNIYISVPGLDGIKIGTKLLIMKSWIAMILWQDFALYVLTRENIVSSLYCHAVLVCSQPNHPSYKECCVESEHTWARTVALLEIVEMLILIVVFMVWFSPYEKGLNYSANSEEVHVNDEDRKGVENEIDAKDIGTWNTASKRGRADRTCCSLFIEIMKLYDLGTSDDSQ